MSEQRTDIDIKTYLPHSKPMLMVDVIERMCFEEVMSSFYIDESCLFIEDGFLTETGLIENAAQTCSAISGQHYFNKEDQQVPAVIGFISSIKKIQIFGLPRVHSTIKTQARLISQSQNPQFSICTFQVSIYQEDTEFLEGVMNLFLQKTTQL